MGRARASVTYIWALTPLRPVVRPLARQEAFKVFQAQVLSERSLRGIEALIAELGAIPDAPGAAQKGSAGAANGDGVVDLTQD